MFPIEQAAIDDLTRTALLFVPLILTITQATKWAGGARGWLARVLAVVCGLAVMALAYAADLMPAGTSPAAAVIVALLATGAAALTHDGLTDAAGGVRRALTARGEVSDAATD